MVLPHFSSAIHEQMQPHLYPFLVTDVADEILVFHQTAEHQCVNLRVR